MAELTGYSYMGAGNHAVYAQSMRQELAADPKALFQIYKHASVLGVRSGN